MTELGVLITGAYGTGKLSVVEEIAELLERGEVARLPGNRLTPEK